jgi:acetyltransferase-like isoleucine patch superfamily enzyme
MGIDKFDYIFGVLRTNPGDLPDIIASALTTFKYRFVKRCSAKGTIIRKKTQIINYANVRIGENCIFQDFIYIRAGVRGNVTFMNNCMVNSFCRLFGHGGIEIGEHSQLGPGVTITTTAHDYEKDDLQEIFKKVTIGKRVWIGANVTILPGVTIGDNAVVGAGSIVTKDIPSDSIAVGVPAKVIRYKTEHSGGSK